MSRFRQTWLASMLASIGMLETRSTSREHAQRVDSNIRPPHMPDERKSRLKRRSVSMRGIAQIIERGFYR